ncbi:TetR/AcrR family transcriptional regulator [Magnetovibrio sp. PR-2]|uniref:TetR/AcrR family transcriptional regulator n=1 Tax=Magnetovibrio sp. PR-2 TaxID=3120356 RepID=UPI002FCDFF88
MGRKKKYDRDQLVAQALELFRDHGFAGTSAEMLVEALGVNRYSLYAEFGSKQELFDIVLQRYDDQVVDRNFGPLEKPGAGIDEIKTLLAFFGSAEDSPALGRGCLLCNTAVEFGPEDPSGAGFVQRYFTRLSNAFRCALDHAQKLGELNKGVIPRQEADFLTASVLGLFVMLRAKAPSTVIRAAALAATQHLEGLLNRN